MAFVGLELGLDLEMWAAHPHQKFQGVPPPPSPRVGISLGLTLTMRKRQDVTEKLTVTVKFFSYYFLLF